MKPHATFNYTRADEVAECWDGVGADLYAKLWNVIVPKQKPIPNLEDSGPHDHVGHANLAAHWSCLTADEQEHLNLLAQGKDDEFQAWLTKPCRKDSNIADAMGRCLRCGAEHAVDCKPN